MLDSEGLQPPSDIATLERILNRTASLLQARGCGVFVWDRDRNTLTAMRPFAGLDETRVKDLEFPVYDSAIGASVLQDRPVLLDELQSNGYVDVQLLKDCDVHNVVSVPLALEKRDESNEVVERQIMGLFCAFDKYYGRAFDLEDARLLGMMARQASAVLVTSQIYWREVARAQRKERVFESTSVGIMAVSLKGTVTEANAAARRALEIPDTGWFGTSFRDLIRNQEIGALIEDALQGRPRENNKELTLMVPDQDGRPQEQIYRIQLDQIRSEDGQPQGWVIVFENITEIKEGEKMMAAFVDMVSHELRTPLTPIRGFVSTLLQGGEGMFDWETEKEFLQIVDTEAERLGVLIDDFLNIARIQNGRALQFAFAPVSVESVAEHVCRLHRQSSHMKGNHNLIVDVSPDLTMQADEGKLQQILHNLVGNALKYSPNGGDVRITAQPDGDGIHISIKDQGLGIPPDQLPKMFGQFFRVESSGHTGIKGTGLGLWLTRHMVEGHHGRIWVESDYGNGSTFHLWFPRDPGRYQANGH